MPWALLEGIARTGSLSAAARGLEMSYRRAWLLLDGMNKDFRAPVATLKTGGPGGGGARVTPFGAALVKAYRRLESQVERRVPRAFGKLPYAAPRPARRRSPAR
jgi:molybdate transport system regulatory protein